MDTYFIAGIFKVSYFWVAVIGAIPGTILAVKFGRNWLEKLLLLAGSIAVVAGFILYLGIAIFIILGLMNGGDFL